MLRQFPLTLLFATALLSLELVADTVTYQDEEGNEISIEARLLGEGQGFQVFERRDGQLQIVPNGAVTNREPNDAPAPFTTEQMSEMLIERFGDELIRVRTDRNNVVGLILASELPESSEKQADTFIKKASTFMSNVDSIFLRYAESRRFPLKDPVFPLVMLIFESDEDFNAYATEATGGRGLMVENILGFYSPITNWLAVRMGSCDTFEVPLHEAIHLQMYNRVFNRLAPIPKWFDEGIATGFEGDGNRITVLPGKVNSNYARRAAFLSDRIDWKDVVSDDGAFTADILAGDAYTLAWCMHWILTTRHVEEYQAYVKELSTRQTLESLDSEERVKRFEETFGLSIAELQDRFPQSLQIAARAQKVRLDKSAIPKVADRTQSLGQVEMQAVESRPGTGVEAAGKLKNLSPLRTLTFYVTMETADGTYADWVLPNLRPGSSAELRRRKAVRPFNLKQQFAAGTYQIFIRSVPAESDAAKAWQSGEVPGPKLAD